MRQRITFIQEPQDSIDPKTLNFTKNAISTTNIKGAREDRVTFGFEELPQELYRVLKGSHDLHVRWVAEREYHRIGPMVSRLSPGLHVFWTTQRHRNDSRLLCPALKKVFGDLDCISPEESFTKLPTEGFSSSSPTQYYFPAPNIRGLQTYLAHKLCGASHEKCLARTMTLGSATYLDIDFDNISHALTLTAYWPSQRWDLDVTNTTPADRLEVGILSMAPSQEPEELSLGGFLAVVGEDTKPSPTLFSFPARHHSIDSTFTTSFNQPTGLHPTLKIAIRQSAHLFDEDDRLCSLHAHLTLPRGIFADKYQLSDPLFLASKKLSSLHYITTPLDLEAPAYTIPIWGSSLLLELAPSSAEEFQTEIPLHLRYLEPNSEGYGKLGIPYPVLFWACTSNEGTVFSINPFDRVNLGYDGLFSPRTIFYHLQPAASGRLVNEVSVPVLRLNGSNYIEAGTAAVVGLGFLWVVGCLVGVWRRSGYGNAKKQVEEGKKNL